MRVVFDLRDVIVRFVIDLRFMDIEENNWLFALMITQVIIWMIKIVFYATLNKIKVINIHGDIEYSQINVMVKWCNMGDLRTKTARSNYTNLNCEAKYIHTSLTTSITMVLSHINSPWFHFWLEFRLFQDFCTFAAK